MPSRAYLAKRFGPVVTDAEILLHRKMSEAGLKFKSQWRIQTENGCFLVDFLVEDNLVVEVDGSSHSGKTALRKDAWKNMELLNAGYKVLRFKNIEVYRDVENVVAKIRDMLEN